MEPAEPIVLAEYDFAAGGNARTVTGEGWSRPEQRWTWTSGSRARLAIPVGGFAGALRGRLWLMPFVQAPYLLRQRLEIVVDGRTVFSDAISSSREAEFNIPDAALNGGLLTIDLLCPDSISPLATGSGPDPRMLGFACLRLRLLGRPPPTGTAVPLPTYGGLDQPEFEATADLAAFGRAGRPLRLQVFAAVDGLAQIPLFQESAFATDFVAEHYRYPRPPDVAVYALPGGTLWGNGLLVRDGKFFLQGDFMPGYFRGYVDAHSHRFPTNWAGPLGSPTVETLRIDGACGLAVHPNLVYGHFLLETLTKLFLLRMLGDLGLPCRIPLSRQAPPWVRAFLDIYFSDEDILLYDMNTQNIVAERYFAPSMMHTDHNFHPAFNLMVNDLLWRLGVPPASAAGPGRARRVYLSRRKLRKGWHYLRNEAAVEEAMADLGFVVIYPETLSLREQFTLMAHADVVAGEYGSALHNTMFSPPGTKVIGLNCINWYQSAIGRVRGHRLAFVPPADGHFRTWRGRGVEEPDFDVDIDRLREVVSGFLAAAPPSPA